MNLFARFFIALILIGCSIGCKQSPSAAVPSLNIEGKYRVSGTNPDGKGSYTGSVAIAKRGDSYALKWNVGNTYDGVGHLNGNVLTVEWGIPGQDSSGLVTYTVQPDGVLQGTWYLNKNPQSLGTEILVPRR